MANFQAETAKYRPTLGERVETVVVLSLITGLLWLGSNAGAWGW
jgi:hypothetical protein